MKTISKNALLFALLVCCNQTIKSAAAAAAAVEYQGIEKSTMQDWLVALQKAEKNGIADKKDTNPEEYGRLADLIASIEAVKHKKEEAEQTKRRESFFRMPSLVSLRVQRFIKELSKQLGIETERERERNLIQEELQDFIIESKSESSLTIITTEPFVDIAKRLYRAKISLHFVNKPELWKLCKLSPEEQKAHVKSLRQDKQEALLESLERPYEENNQFFQGLGNLLPKAPDKSIHSYVNLPDETKQKICTPLNISSLYESLGQALTPQEVKDKKE